MVPSTDRKPPDDHFSAEHVGSLFSDMSATYGRLNLISSFGFSHFWRVACARELRSETPVICADLMCGGAEAALLLWKILPKGSTIRAFDFCAEMCRLARESATRKQAEIPIELRDVFTIPATPSFDRIVCTFGLKTLSDAQLTQFAVLARALLRPGGVAAFVEIHIPSFPILRGPYLFYLRRIIPWLGRIAQRNADCYRWLAVYTEGFATRDRFARQLMAAGLRCEQKALFFGCARLYIARKLQ